MPRLIEEKYIDDVLFRKCSKCSLFKVVNEFPIFKTTNNLGKRIGICKSCKREIANTWYRENKDTNVPKKRQKLEAILPKEWGSRDTIDLIKLFNYRCAFTDLRSIDSDIGIDHFIALSTGHCGTYKANLLPLERSINISKRNKNPFEWIETRPDISKVRFDFAVGYLAELNNMNSSEYKDFVYFCYDNPRDITTILSSDKSSISMFKGVI